MHISSFDTGCINSRWAVTKWYCTIPVEDPGGRRRWWGSKRWGRYAYNPEVVVSVQSSDLSEEFLYVVNCIELVTSGTVQNSAEIWDISGCWFGHIVETETLLCLHGGVRCHPNLGWCAGGWNHEIVTNKMKLVIFLMWFSDDDGYVVLVTCSLRYRSISAAISCFG